MPSLLASHPARPREKRQSKIDDLKKWAAAFRAPPTIATSAAASAASVALPPPPPPPPSPAVSTPVVASAPVASAPVAAAPVAAASAAAPVAAASAAASPTVRASELPNDVKDKKAKIEDLKKWGAGFRTKPQKGAGSAEGSTEGTSDPSANKPPADSGTRSSPLTRTSSFLKRPSIAALGSLKDAAKAAAERRKTKKQSDASPAPPKRPQSPSGPASGGVVLPHTLHGLDEWEDSDRLGYEASIEDSERAGYGRERANTSQMQGNEPRGSLDELDPELVDLMRIGRDSIRFDDDRDVIQALASDAPDEVEVEMATILQKLLEERSAIAEVLQAEPQENDLEAALATATRLMTRQQELENEMTFLAQELEKRQVRRGQPIAIPDDRRVSYTHAL